MGRRRVPLATVRAGFWLNVAGIVLIVVISMTWLPVAWGIDVTQLPPWAG